MKGRIVNIVGPVRSKVSLINGKLTSITSVKSYIKTLKINKEIVIYAKELLLNVFGMDRVLNFFKITKQFILNFYFLENKNEQKTQEVQKIPLLPNVAEKISLINPVNVIKSDSLVQHISSGIMRSVFKKKNKPVSVFKLEKSKSEDNISIK